MLYRSFLKMIYIQDESPPLLTYLTATDICLHSPATGYVVLSLVDGCRLFVYIEYKTFSQIFFLHCYLLPISYSFPSYMVFIVSHEALNLYGS